MDTEKAFKLEKRIELQHITFLRKKKQKQKLEKVILKKNLMMRKKEEAHEKYITTIKSSKPTCNVNK